MTEEAQKIKNTDNVKNSYVHFTAALIQTETTLESRSVF